MQDKPTSTSIPPRLAEDTLSISDKTVITLPPAKGLTEHKKYYLDEGEADEKKSVRLTLTGDSSEQIGRLAGYLWDKTTTVICLNPVVMDELSDSQRTLLLQERLTNGHSRRPPTESYQLMMLCQQQGCWFGWVWQFNPRQTLTGAIYLHPLVPTWDKAWARLLPGLTMIGVQILALPAPGISAEDSGYWLLGMLQLTLKQAKIPALTLKAAPLRKKYLQLLTQAFFVPLYTLPSGLACDLAVFTSLQAQLAAVLTTSKKQPQPQQKTQRKLALQLHQRQQSLLKKRTQEMDKAQLTRDAMNYAAAIAHWWIILALEERILECGVLDPQVVMTLTNIGIVYEEHCALDQALYYYQQALQISEKIAGARQPMAAFIRCNIGSAYCERGQYATALSYYQQALDIQEATLDADHSQLADTLQSIALLYSAQSAHAKATTYYERASKIMRASCGADDEKRANLLSRIGLLHFKQRDYAHALDNYHQALAIQEVKFGTNHPAVAKTLSEIADIYAIQHLFPKAQPLYQRALGILETTLGKNHASTANTLHSLGNFYNMQANHDNALRYYQRALTIQKSLFGLQHRKVAVTLNNIGMVYEQQCEYVSALAYYQRSLDIRETIFGHDNVEVAQVLQHIADIYTHLADQQQALPYLQRIQHIYETMGDVDQSENSDWLFNTAHIYAEQANYAQALTYYHQALVKQKAVWGDHHPMVANTLRQMAAMYLAQSAYAKAMTYALQALHNYETHFPANHPQIARALTIIGNVLFSQNIYPDALNCYQKALAMQEKCLGVDHAEVGLTLHNIANVYLQQANYDKALACYQRALQLTRVAWGAEHPKAATMLQSIATVYAQQFDYVNALKYAQASLAIHTTKLGDDHPKVALNLYNMAVFYQEQSAYSDALKYHTRAHDIFLAKLGSLASDTCRSQRNIALTYENSALYTPTASADERQALLKQASEALASLYQQHLTLFEQQPKLVNSVYDLAVFDHLVKDLARLYRRQGQHRSAYALYVAEAQRWQAQFPVLALRYVSKARREMALFTSKPSDQAQLCRLEATLYAQQQRWPRALQALAQLPDSLSTASDRQLVKTCSAAWQQQCRQWVDEDLVGEWQRCLDSVHEIEVLLFKDLSQGSRLSETVKNRITEVIIKLRNLLDQSTGRFTGECIYAVNAEQRQEVGYFPFAPSEKALHNRWRQEKLIQSNGIPLAIIKKHLDMNSSDVNFVRFWQALEDGGLVKKIDHQQAELTALFDPSLPLPPPLATRFAHLPALMKCLQQKKPGDRLTKAELNPRSFATLAPPAWNDIEKALVAGKFLVAVTDAKGTKILSYQLGSAWQPKQPKFRLELLPPLSAFEPLIIAGLTAAEQQWKSLRTLDQDPKLRPAYEVLLKHQAFRYYHSGANEKAFTAGEPALWEQSWLDTLIAIGNDSKHVRLTPQASQGRLAQEHGLIHHRQMRIVIEYIEPEGAIYAWTFVSLLFDVQPVATRLQLSKAIYSALRRSEQLKNVDGLMIANPLHTAAFIDALRRKADDPSLHTAQAAYTRQIKQALLGIATLQPHHIKEIGNGLLRRAAQRQQLSFVPDRELEVHTLLGQGLTGVAEIVSILGDIRQQHRTLHHTPEAKQHTSAIGLTPDRFEHKSTPPLLPKQPLSLKPSTLTLTESHRYWLSVEQQAQAAYKAGDISGAADCYQHALQQLPNWLHGLCYQRLTWLMGASLQAQKLRTQALTARADYYEQHGLKRLSHTYWQKASASVEPRLNTSLQTAQQTALSAYQSWQAQTDQDLRSQLEHAMESIQLLPEQLWRATAPTTSPLTRFEIENRLGELVVKLRHLLDQSLSRWINRSLRLPNGQSCSQHKYPSRGTKLSLARWALVNGLVTGARDFHKEEEITDTTADKAWTQLNQQYPQPSVWSVLVASQPFAARTTSTEGGTVSWLELLSSLANTSKHTRLPQLNWSALTPELSLTQFEQTCAVYDTHRKLAEWSFTPMLSLTQSAEFYQALVKKNYLTGSPGYKQLTQPDCLALAEAVAAQKPVVEISVLTKKLADKLRKEFTPWLATSSPLALQKIIDVLQVQAHLNLHHNPSAYSRPQSVAIFPLLRQSLAGISAIFSAIYADLPQEKDRMALALRKLLFSPSHQQHPATTKPGVEKDDKAIDKSLAKPALVSAARQQTSAVTSSSSTSSSISTAQNRHGFYADSRIVFDSKGTEADRALAERTLRALEEQQATATKAKEIKPS